jgi:hypothetical protein
VSYDLLTIGGSPRGFEINGRSLAALIYMPTLISVYDLEQDARQAYVRQLLRRQVEPRWSLPSGRCPLYVCAQCADLGCGAIAVRVTEVDDCFVWSELSHDDPNGRGGDGEAWGTPVTWRDDRDERAFYFAREDYLRALY